MFITYAVSNIFGVLDITDDEFVTADKSYLTIVSKNIDTDTYEKYEKDDRFSYIMPGDSTDVYKRQGVQKSGRKAVYSGSAAAASERYE